MAGKMPASAMAAFKQGARFNRWTVVLPSVSALEFGEGRALCRCDCGVEAPVRRSLLLRGESKQCRACGNANRKARPRTKVHKPTYNSWAAMKTRCQRDTYSEYHYYGGRGIKVCAQWQRFAGFVADMGERPVGRSLDRIDPDGDYEPANCRWATTHEQRINRRDRRS